MSDGHGIMHRATPNPVVVNNTVWDVDHGISQNVGSGADFTNNLVGAVAAGGHHLGWGDTVAGANSTVRNNLLGGGVRLAWGSTIYTSLSSFASATGKGSGMLNADPSFVPGSLLIAPDSPAVNAS